jgi:osmotically-inducible protein OsmY
MKAQKTLVWVVAGLLALGAAACTSTTGRSASRTVDDAAITASVKSKLAADQASSFANIDVDTVRGTVYLTGIAPDSAAKRRATDIAQDVDGVTRVVNNLQLKTSAAGDAPRDLDRDAY